MSRLQVKAKCRECGNVFQMWVEVWTSLRVGDILAEVRCVICKTVTPMEVVER